MRNIIKLMVILLLVLILHNEHVIAKTVEISKPFGGTNICMSAGICTPSVMIDIPDNYNIRLYSDKLFQSYCSDIILHEIDSSELLKSPKTASYAADLETEKSNKAAAYKDKKDGSILILDRAN